MYSLCLLDATLCIVRLDTLDLGWQGKGLLIYTGNQEFTAGDGEGKERETIGQDRELGGPSDPSYACKVELGTEGYRTPCSAVTHYLTEHSAGV